MKQPTATPTLWDILLADGRIIRRARVRDVPALWEFIGICPEGATETLVNSRFVRELRPCSDQSALDPRPFMEEASDR